MATKQNRLTLRIGVVFDKKKALKEAKGIQTEIDKQSEKMYKKQLAKEEALRRSREKNNKALKEQQGLFGKISTSLKKASVNFLKFFVIAQAFLLLKTQIANALKLMLDLDTAFTNFAIVSKATASQIAVVNAEIDKATLELGKLKKEVIDTVTEFSRAGFNIEESMILARNAIMGANVGATELSNITTFLIAGLKAFNFEAEESGRILDVLLKVANTTAINLEGIGEAFLRSANTLNTAGASLEQSAALIAGANESIQDPAKVGTALKTIASRLRGVTDAGVAIPKLKESFDAVGVSIQNADGSFRNIFDVFQDLAKVLPTLDDLTKESLLEKLAGKRQKNIVIGLLNNFDTVEQALKDALNSTGEVAQANEKFLDSLQGRTNQLKEAWNQLLTALSNDTVIKALVTGLKNIVVGLTAIIKNTPKVISLAIGLGVALSPLGTVVTIIGGITAGLSALGIVSDITTSKIKKLNKQIIETEVAVNELNSKMQQLEEIPLEKRTKAQQDYLELLREELKLKKEILAGEQLELVEERTKKVAKVRERINEALETAKIISEDLELGGATYFTPEELGAVLDGLKKQESELKKFKLALSEANSQLDESSLAYIKNDRLISLINVSLSRVSESYANTFGLAVDSATESVEENTEVIAEQISLFERVKSLIGSTSSEYQVASDALEQLESQGYLTDEMLDTLIKDYPQLVKALGRGTDAFKEQVEVIKAGSIEQIDALEALANAEIITAKAIIQSREAVTFAQQGYSTARAGDIDQVNLMIENAEDLLTSLDNERKQIEGADTARKKALETKDKDVKVLSDMELALLKVNNQIEMQEKLLARTDSIEEKIALNEKLSESYEEQRELLMKQQVALSEEGKGFQQGTEKYDEFIKESYKLSSAIEDSTNSIYSITKAISGLNKELQDNRIVGLKESLSNIFTESSANLQNSAEIEVQSIKDKITALDEEYALRKKNLDISREDFDHAKKMADFNKSISEKEIESQMLQLDNSLESQRRRAVLAEELADLEKSKKEDVDDFTRVLKDRELENEYQNEKDSLERRLKSQEQFVQDLVTATSLAMENIQDEVALTTIELEDTLTLFATELGKILEENIGGSFDGLSEEATKYLKLLGGTGGGSGTGGVGGSGGTDSDGGDGASSGNVSQVVAQMKANGSKWFASSEEERARLNAENVRLAKSINYKYDQGGYYIPSWLSNSASFEDKQKYRLYDNGGKLEQGEVAVNKEQNDEWVLTDRNLMSIFNSGMSRMFTMSSVDSSVGEIGQGGTKVDKMINIENQNNVLSDDVDVERLGENMARGSKNKLNSYGYRF